MMLFLAALLLQYHDFYVHAAGFPQKRLPVTLRRYRVCFVTLLLSKTYALCKCIRGISPFTSPHMMRGRKKIHPWALLALL